MVRSLSTRGMPKPVAILVAALLTLYFVPLTALPAGAADVGGFEIEGDLFDSPAGGAIDWSNLGPGTPGFSTDVDNTTQSGQDATTFKGASKEFNLQSEAGGWPRWQFGSGQATGKSDFGRWATYSRVIGSNVWLYLGFDRGFGTGTGKYVFELNQVIQDPATDANPTRSQGDVRLVVFDQGNGLLTLTPTPDGRNDDVGLYTWDDPDQPSGGTALDSDKDGVWVKSTTNGTFVGASNTASTPIPVPTWWTSPNLSGGTLGKDMFAEFAINLSSFGAVLGCPSAGFSAANARSLTGTGEPGTLVDYLKALPVSIPSTCASLYIKKFKGDGTTPLAGALFRITPNPLPQDAPNRPSDDFLLIRDDGDDNTDLNGGNYDDPDATAGVITLSAVVPGTYTVTEEAAPEGWIKDSGSVVLKPVNFGTAPDPTGGQDGAGKNVAAFVNRLGSVKFFKTYEGGNPPAGATFRLVRDSDGDGDYTDESGANVIVVQDNGSNDANDALGIIKVNDLKTGSYQLTETEAPIGWVKDGDAVTFAIPGANQEADVVLAPATFDNPRKTYDLTVVKVAESDGTKIDGAVFDLYKETNSTAGLQRGDNGDAKVGTCTTGALPGDDDKGQCSIGNLAWGEKYYWYEVSVPAPYNLPSNRVIGPILLTADGSTDPADSRSVTFRDPQSAIRTQATGGNLPDATISDKAFVTGVNDSNAGSVTFYYYGPFATAEIGKATCAFTPGSYASGPNYVGQATDATGVKNGEGEWVYESGARPVPDSGYYAWIAVYNGDGNGNRAVAGECGDPNETSYVEPLQPGITTVAQAEDAQLPGIELYDTAKVSPVTADLDTAVANVDFYLYGPGDTDCSGTPVFTSENRPVTVVQGDNGYYATATSATYEAAGQAGRYRWVAHFDGDANNVDADSPCNADNEHTDVAKANPSVTTDIVGVDPADDVVVGEAGTTITDSATLQGATADVTGSIVFKLYYSETRPDADDCVGTPVATVTRTLQPGVTTYQASRTVTTTGWYNWTAQYVPDGDPNNTASAVHGCGVDAEMLELEPREPAITTQVPQTVLTLGPDGSDLTDTATLSGGTTQPPVGGSIRFVLYGPFEQKPDAQSCADPVEGEGGNRYPAQNNPQTVEVDGNGDYTTASAVRVTEAGWYTWVATYLGDDSNRPASHACGLASETVQVQPRQPVISTQVSATQLVLGDQQSVSFSDKATISEATTDVTGTISFRLHGPGATVEAACATTGAVQGQPVAVNGNGEYQGPTVSVGAPGYYSWVATFTPAPGEGNNLPATHACGLPSETVLVLKGQKPVLEKIANPPSGSIVQRGDTVTYTVTVKNEGDVPIDDGALKDTLPPYVTVDQASVTAAGGSYTPGGDRTVSSGLITWIVDLAPGASRSFTYKVTIDQDAPELKELVNLAEFLGLRATTTHRVPEGDLTIVKEVSPVAGDGVVVEFGDTLTYTLTVSASGQQTQTNVVVTDYVPGLDPARPSSGSTTYVPGSARCLDAGTCTVTEPGADGLITWSLGSMAAGTSRQVTFQVTIDDVVGNPGEVVAVDILNAGAVRSTETPTKPSNEVVTPVTKVLPVKVENPPPPEEEPRVLPRTGSTLPLGPLAGIALTLVGLGLALVSGTRRRGTHRKV